MREDPRFHPRRPAKLDWLDKWSGYLLRTALPTGQLLDEAAATRVISHEQYLNELCANQSADGTIVYRQKSSNGELGFFWNPPMGGDSQCFDLELLKVDDWSVHYRDFTVGELLPLLSDEMIPLLKDRVAQNIGRPEASSRLAIKHALAREMFGFNSNRAAIRFACGVGRRPNIRSAIDESTPEESDPLDPNSLHHYIHPSCTAVTDAFRIAQERLWGIESPTAAPVLAAAACTLIKPTRLSRILDSFKARLAESGTLDFKEQHNLLATYTALILLISTAHRTTACLFHFYFTLNLEEAVAFISDKQRIGSEARFVPLAPTAIAQVRTYLRHLNQMTQKMKRSGERLGWVISSGCGISPPRSAFDAGFAGFMFVFEGETLLPISTSYLEGAIRETEDAIGLDIDDVSLLTARALRRNFATYLGNRGVSGCDIEFLLGHNSELHAWGPAACRIPSRRLENASALIEDYLKAYRAIPVSPCWIKDTTREPQRVVPSFHQSKSDFEGREFASAAAEARARAAILKVVDPEELQDRGILVIDDEVLKTIQEEIEFELAGDATAKSKVLSELSGMVSKWRKAGRANASAALLNLTRHRPGPIDVLFGRHLSIAVSLQDHLSKAIHSFLQEERTSSKERLGVIAVMLALTEAVLRLEDIAALVDAIQNDGVGRFGESCDRQLRIRTQVESRHAIYARTCDLSDKCGAAVTGYLRTRVGKTSYSWSEISISADQFLRYLCEGLQEPLSLAQLTVTLQPYWALRLPGTAYACCVGQFDTSAESENSARTLLGGVPISTGTVKRNGTRMGLPKNQGVGLARAALLKLFADSRGVVEKHEQNKPRQRAALREYFKVKLPEDLVEWSAQQSIVEHWVAFLEHMLDKGGPRASEYAHSTMESYQFSVIPELLDSGWDKDLETMNADEFDELYSDILTKIPDARRPISRTVLQFFHEFLRGHISAPKCATFPFCARPKRKVRNLLYSKDVIMRAIQLAQGVGGKHTRFGVASSRLIAVNAKWALRTKEGYGLRQSDYWANQGSALSVRRNLTRGVKSPSGLRRVSVGLSNSVFKFGIRSIFTYGRHYGRITPDETPLFIDSKESSSNLLQWSQVRGHASWALKTAALDSSAVIHSLRHTWGSSALCMLLLPDPSGPIAKAIVTGLPEIDKTELQTVHPNPDAYANFTDVLSMWLGHGSVDTLITTYGHTIWLSVSDRCFKAAQLDPLPNGANALLMGLDRSTVSKRRKEMRALEAPALEVHQTISQYIGDVIPSLLHAPVDTLEQLSGEELSAPHNMDQRTQIEVVAHFLAIRHFEKQDKDGIATRLSDTLGVSADVSSALFSAYVEVVNETGFTDFEPIGTLGGRQARFGLKQAQVVRRNLLSRIQELCSCDLKFLACTGTIARRWVQSVKATSPMLVLRDMQNLRNAKEWLLTIGYEAHSIKVTLYRVPDSDLLPSDMPEIQIARSTTPMGRGIQTLVMPEFGLTTLATQRLPGEREFQRVLFALAVFDRAGLLETASNTFANS